MEGCRPGHNLRLGIRTELTLMWEKAPCVLCVRGGRIHCLREKAAGVLCVKKMSQAGLWRLVSGDQSWKKPTLTC